MRLVDSGWEPELRDGLAMCEGRLLVAYPFIKHSVVVRRPSLQLRPSLAADELSARSWTVTVSRWVQVIMRSAPGLGRSVA